ncbi:SIS domain-containing protein [Janibacter sp. GXQ6167]|uniref:SIS domain-containing protein n=1 Tax=Janibacter sp. GXQ6167 TaxID=3240791 RepID=UPI003525110D
MTPFDETRLDDAEARSRIDRSDMLRALATAGAQARLGWTLAEEAGIARLTGGERPRAVHIAALGASETVAEIASALVRRSGSVLVTTGGSGSLPGWVGPLDLVIGVSLTGRAEGPVAQAHEAARRGAAVLTVGRPGTALSEASARARGIHVPVGDELRRSRTALWSLAIPALAGLAAADVIDLPADLPGRVADRLDEHAESCRPDAEHFVNPAKMLALGLAPVVPTVFGDGPLTGVAARRAAAMLSRTARIPASSGRLPDDASRLIACLEGPWTGAASAAPDGGRDIFADPYLDAPSTPPLGVLLLRDPLPEPVTPSDATRHDVAQSIHDHAERSGAMVREVVAEAGPDLVRLAGLIALTDLAATYLSIGYGIDPATAPGLRDIHEGA